MKEQTGSFVRAVPEVDERRRHQRVESQGASIELSLSGQPLAFTIDNLSEGGALIAGRIPLDRDLAFELHIQLPGGAPIHMWARVVRYTLRAGQDFTALLFLSSSDELAHWISDVVLQGLRAAFPEL
ncbi:MAG TPA: PilZ domain-containing protein [Polyangia bacterium]|nr:PilZ domain-containing protein [Polyangia bacterium]